ncbi:jg12401 [Pararge aegeria aegeria]|uniref:Jg12401 protein n=1 Tax=Pararge aegeria aegeria TaxID=348720 RepID=A0A8S4S7G1_9NEOP|nr:jg12401 [Pararge aegeria aegeria]
MMNTRSVLMLFALYGVLVLVRSEYTSYQQSQGEIYCGRRLANALALICDGNLIKRSEPHVGFNWPLMSHHKAHSLMRNKRQVVSECCEKPCTRSELLSYCA